ncbi:molybdenum cofactor guanylyltransferase [Thermaurantiacus sp.]
MTAGQLLGAVLAGGKSRRFGSDKALALVEGKPLIQHALDCLAASCEIVVVVGRDWPGHARLDDHPAPGLGPLAGLCAALLHAGRHGFDHALVIPCDMPGLPADLAARLAPAPAVVDGHWTIGIWPSKLGPALAARLEGGGPMSLRGFAQEVNARRVQLPGLVNVNQPSDLPDGRHVLSKQQAQGLPATPGKG